MYCSSCGTELPAGARFCAKCGCAVDDRASSGQADLASSEAIPEPAVVGVTQGDVRDSTPVATAPEPGRTVGRSRMLIAVLLGIVAGLALVAVILFVISGTRGSQSEDVVVAPVEAAREASDEAEKDAQEEAAQDKAAQEKAAREKEEREAAEREQNTVLVDNVAFVVPEAWRESMRIAYEGSGLTCTTDKGTFVFELRSEQSYWVTSYAPQQTIDLENGGKLDIYRIEDGGIAGEITDAQGRTCETITMCFDGKEFGGFGGVDSADGRAAQVAITDSDAGVDPEQLAIDCLRVCAENITIS